MTHTLPHHIAAILETWDNIGFKWIAQAAEFILANKDWNELIKDTVFEEADVKTVNEWRRSIIEVAKDHSLARKGIE